MSRPSTQRRGRNHDGMLTDDDFLFVPPATASSTRSPRTARGTSSHGERIRTTIVGVGTIGMGERGCKMEAPANVHREWLREKRTRSPPSSNQLELPSLSPREQFESRKVQRSKMLSLKEEHDEELARKCAEEKKARVAEAKAIKADAENFTKEYVKDLVQRDREERERSKKARDEELKLHQKWCKSMAAAARAEDPTEASSRREAAIEASKRTRQLIEELVKEAHPDEKSPPRVHAKEVADVRKAVLADHHLWMEMKSSQAVVDREVTEVKHKQVNDIHENRRTALMTEFQKKHENSEAQRKSLQSYREQWDKEIEVWNRSRGESAKLDRDEYLKAMAARINMLRAAAEAENEAAVKEREALKAQRQKNKEEYYAFNRERAEAVRQTVQLTASAREAQMLKNRKAFVDAKADSERRKSLKQRDREEDFLIRKALHDEEAQRARSPKSPRPTTSSSSKNGRTPAPPGTAPNTGRRATQQPTDQ